MRRSILRKRIRARLNTTSVVMRAFSNQIFTQNGFEITPEQYTILTLIIENEELYQRQLSEITLKDRSNISRIIKILEEKELIVKITDSNGRQIFKVKATQKGIDLHKKMAQVAKIIRQTATKGISNEDMEICLNTLDKIFNNLENKVKLQI